MRTSAKPAPPVPPAPRSALKVVSECDFGTTEADLRRDVIDALGERSRLVRASASGLLLGLLALLFAGHAVAVAVGAATPAFVRFSLATALVLVAALVGMIAHGLRTPAEVPAPPAREIEPDSGLVRRTG